MADVTISDLTPGKPSNTAVVPYSEGGVTKSTTVSNFGVPVGAVFHLATSTVPVGYLKCNGNVVPNGSGTVQGVTADFSALYSALSNTYGSLGQLPDLRGEFVRGFDDGRSIDSGRVFGSNQVDNLKSHNHTGALPEGGVWFRMFQYTGDTYRWPSEGGPGAFADRLTGSTGGTDTRPRNVALMAVIKY